MGADFRGDPSSALLEVLDPEQNDTFNDHYLEVDYNLSDVMFVTTANTLNMPQPLMDRMEVIHIPGYTEDEKVQIAIRHLIPKQLEAHGLKEGEWTISETALRDLIRHYTREAGVRNLERQLANLARKAIREIMQNDAEKVTVTRRNLEKFAGVRRYRYGEIEEEDAVGVTTGLAWTEVGGELLAIEAVVVPGKGKMTITGKLGDVMQESVQAAASYVHSRGEKFGIPKKMFSDKDIHIHVPEGATPKDGPSAGVGMCTSIVSVLTKIPIRRDIAMTGEITLRGRVLPIGGLKEKLLAALRAGLKTVLIPKDNEKDLAEIPDNVKKGLELIPVAVVDDVLEHALTGPLTPVQWEDDSVGEKVPADKEADNIGGVVTH
jgi:ATP-dependent Lon protease